jgi:hypothetical protein
MVRPDVDGIDVERWLTRHWILGRRSLLLRLVERWYGWLLWREQERFARDHPEWAERMRAYYREQAQR